MYNSRNDTSVMESSFTSKKKEEVAKVVNYQEIVSFQTKYLINLIQH